jgi:hypothetical protein
MRRHEFGDEHGALAPRTTPALGRRSARRGSRRARAPSAGWPRARHRQVLAPRETRARPTTPRRAGPDGRSQLVDDRNVDAIPLVQVRPMPGPVVALPSDAGTYTGYGRSSDGGELDRELGHHVLLAATSRRRPDFRLTVRTPSRAGSRQTDPFRGIVGRASRVIGDGTSHLGLVQMRNEIVITEANFETAVLDSTVPSWSTTGRPGAVPAGSSRR